MHGSWKPHTQVRVSSKEKKRSLKNDINQYWQLHVYVTTSSSSMEVPMEMPTWICSPAAFVASHRCFWDKGTALLDGNCLSKASTWALAPTRTQCIPLDPPQAAVESSPPPSQEPSNHSLGKILPKSLLAEAFTCCSAAHREPCYKWLLGSLSTKLGHLGAWPQVPLFLCYARGSGSRHFLQRCRCCPALLPHTPTSHMLFVSLHSARAFSWPI